MAASNTLQHVQDAYAAFGRGDIPALMELLADDIEWIIPGPTDLPWKGVRYGKPAVQEWFGLLFQNIEFRAFAPQQFITDGDTVVCLVHNETTMRRTGRSLSYTEAQIWRFRDNKLVRFQIFEDTAAIAAAYRGE